MPSENEAYNRVQLIGNLGADPEVKYFESGSRVAEIRIAVYNGKDKATGEVKPSMWFTVKAWNDTADAIVQDFRKGDRIAITQGQLAQDTWNDRETGKPRTKDYVLAWEVEKVERKPTPDGKAVAGARSQPHSAPRTERYDDFEF
jgi:single-strand DNA-binding protein